MIKDEVINHSDFFEVFAKGLNAFKHEALFNLRDNFKQQPRRKQGVYCNLFSVTTCGIVRAVSSLSVLKVNYLLITSDKFTINMFVLLA